MLGVSIFYVCSATRAEPVSSGEVGHADPRPSGPRAHFRFLDGHEPLKWGADSRPIERQSVTFYSYRSDYSDVVRLARAELEPLGFEFEKWKNGGYLMKGPRTNPEPMVVINMACRMSRAESTEVSKFWNEVPKDVGWVSVEVEGMRNPDWKGG